MGIQQNGDSIILSACQKFLESVPPSLNYMLPKKLYEILNSNPERVFVLDNRTPEAFKEGHIPGARNIWMKELLERKNLELLPRNKQIVVCCWVGHTSSQVLTVLQLLGFNAVGLKFGMGESAVPGECVIGWAQQGFPLEYGDAIHDGAEQ